MGWDDCFNFTRLEYTRTDTKATEIYRVLQKGSRFICCSWEAQDDLAWMEDAVLRYYPDMIKDDEYQAEKPIGMAYEKAKGYEIILGKAGFTQIDIRYEKAEFVSSDEEEWWRQMCFIGWDDLLKKIKRKDPDQLEVIKKAIFQDLQSFKQADGIHFWKTVFYVRGTK